MRGRKAPDHGSHRRRLFRWHLARTGRRLFQTLTLARRGRHAFRWALDQWGSPSPALQCADQLGQCGEDWQRRDRCQVGRREMHPGQFGRLVAKRTLGFHCSSSSADESGRSPHHRWNIAGDATRGTGVTASVRRDRYPTSTTYRRWWTHAQLAVGVQGQGPDCHVTPSSEECRVPVLPPQSVHSDSPLPVAK